MRVVDTLDTGAELPEAEPEATEVDPARPCQLPECPNFLPLTAHPRRIYCDAHDGRSPERRRIRRQWMQDHKPAKASDKAPPIALHLGGAGKGKDKKDVRGGAQPGELDAVRQRALQIAQVTAALVLVGTKGPHREADAADIAANSGQWANSVRELAVHEEWLRKLGAGGEVSERAAAWGAFLLATVAMASPILVRHEVIKGGMADLASTILGNAQSLATADDAAA